MVVRMDLVGFMLNCWSVLVFDGGWSVFVFCTPKTCENICNVNVLQIQIESLRLDFYKSSL